MRYNTVLFDLDGTLTDSLPGIVACIRETLAHEGIAEVDEAKLRSFVGPPLHHTLRSYGLDEERCARMVDFYRELYKRRGLEKSSLFPGILALLDALRAGGVRIGVATSKAEPVARMVMDHFGITSKVDVLSAPGMNVTTDIKAELVRRALAALPERPAVMVGDRIYDVEGARANGIDAVYVMYGCGSEAERDACRPDHCVHTVGELSKLLLG